MSAAGQRPQSTCPHYQQGGPRVCPSCHAAPPTQGNSGNAQLSPDHVTGLQKYMAYAQAQGRHDLAALYQHRLAAGAAWNDDRSITTHLLRRGSPSQLPATYPYPTTIEISSSAPNQPTHPGPNQRDQFRQQPYHTNTPASFQQAGGVGQTQQMHSTSRASEQQQQQRPNGHSGSISRSTTAMTPGTSEWNQESNDDESDGDGSDDDDGDDGDESDESDVDDGDDGDEDQN